MQSLDSCTEVEAGEQMDRDYCRTERKPGEVVGFRVGRILRSGFYPGHILGIQNPGLQAGTIQEESDLPWGIEQQGGRVHRPPQIQGGVPIRRVFIGSNNILSESRGRDL